MRVILLISCLVAVTLTHAFAQTSGPSSLSVTTVTVSPAAGDQTVSRELRAQNLPENSGVTITLLAPNGQESTIFARTDAAGNIAVTLPPFGGPAATGLYRAVLPLSDGRAASVVFTVGSGPPTLEAQPSQFSPYSAFQLFGANLPANGTFDLVISLANGRGDRHFFVSTDSAGSMAVSVWPQELGESFFEAGLYRATIPGIGVVATFTVLERPTAPTVTVDGPVMPGGLTSIHLHSYPALRRVWFVYADRQGRVRGELLLGPTDARGSVDAAIRFPALEGGAYLLASPYEWGETGFDVVPPTDTPTLTPTVTATVTPTPTDTPVPPTVTASRAKKICHKGKHGRRRCVRKGHR